MINSEIIKERLKEIDENIKILSDLKKMSLKSFISDVKTCKAAERCLEVSIQCVIDICHHIIAARNWPRPKDSREAIITIGQRGIIPLTFSKRIQPMAGLRNILVHEYIKVDPVIIYKHLRRLADFRKFQKYIIIYLQKHT
ncbi:MAG: DUF86 domain-containing protein [Candidatus Omnitrophota bacterium]